MTEAWAMTDAEIRAVAEGLRDGSWPAARWRHAEHCLATAYFILARPELDLEVELPGMIARYNETQGGRNTDSSGYHHTITIFYLREIRHFLASLPAGLSLAESGARLLASPLGDKDYPLRAYSRERLFSVAARRGWVKPDLARCPEGALGSEGALGQEASTREV